MLGDNWKGEPQQLKGCIMLSICDTAAADFASSDLQGGEVVLVSRCCRHVAWSCAWCITHTSLRTGRLAGPPAKSGTGLEQKLEVRKTPGMDACTMCWATDCTDVFVWRLPYRCHESATLAVLHATKVSWVPQALTFVALLSVSVSRACNYGSMAVYQSSAFHALNRLHVCHCSHCVTA